MTPKHPGGRPTIYTKELGERICKEVRNTVRGLQFICDSHDEFPVSSTVKEWLFDGRYPEFSALYADSKRYQAETLADEVMEVSYNAEEHHRTGGVEKSKLKVDSLKWIAGHLSPKKWNDKFKEKEDQKEETTKMTEDQLKDKFADILNGVQDRIKKTVPLKKVKKKEKK
jgi:hypothetical protein